MDGMLRGGRTSRQSRDVGNPLAPIKIGEHVARLALRAGFGFGYEDLGHPDGHITIWGAPEDLAEAVLEIAPAEL